MIIFTHTQQTSVPHLPHRIPALPSRASNCAATTRHLQEYSDVIAVCTPKEIHPFTPD